MKEENFQIKNNCLTEFELVRGKNGKALFGDWYYVQEIEDCSWQEVKQACHSED